MSYYFGLFWTPTPTQSYCVIIWLTPPPPPMYDAINEYLISLSEYFSDIISNGQRRSLTIWNGEINRYLSKFTVRQCNFCISRKKPPHFYVQGVSEKSVHLIFCNNSVKFDSNSKILDIFEQLIVLAVEKCPRSLNLSKI